MMNRNKIVFLHANVLDGTMDMEPRMANVYVEDGIIKKIAPCETYHREPDKEYVVVDLEGAYLMPGLINLHVHLNSGGVPSNRKRRQGDYERLVRIVKSTPMTREIMRRRSLSYAVTALESGVTTIRTVGGVGAIDSQLRDRIEKGFTKGPQILAANMGISVPGGHVAGSLAYAAKSPEHAAQLVSVIDKDHPDLIKLMITGGIMDAKIKGEPGVLKMPQETIAAACREAHRQGYYVAAHVESTEGVRAALKGGVDCIEHGAEPDEEIMELFHKKNAKLVTTISPIIPMAFCDPSIIHMNSMAQFNARIVLGGIVKNARACLAEGIPVGLGTDTGCPFVTHYDFWRELQYFHNLCDVSRKEALYTATLGNAKIAGVDDRIGSIELGKEADFVITTDNPLESLEALRNPLMVVSRGEVVPRNHRKKYKQIERELDEFLSLRYRELEEMGII